MKEITKEQAEVYGIITNLIIKIALSLVLIISFIVILYAILTTTPSYEFTGILSALEAVLGHTFYQMVKHYFPHK